jgi:hypothetical protein
MNQRTKVTHKTSGHRLRNHRPGREIRVLASKLVRSRIGNAGGFQRERVLGHNYLTTTAR